MGLNLNEWKEFRIGDLFKKVRINKFSSIPESEGDVPFISSTSIDNGISKFVDEKSIKGNCITVSTNGACFDAFYQNQPIVVSSDVEVLYADFLNEKIALFICTLLKLEKPKWSYGRKPKDDKVFNTVIKLPIRKDEYGSPIIDKNKTYSDKGYIPDWNFIEEYMKSLNLRLLTTKKVDTEIPNLNVKKWKEFKIDDLFDEIYKAMPHTKEEVLESKNGIHFVSRTDMNNGIDMIVENSNLQGIEKENCLIIGDTTSTCYYQNKEFITGDHIIVLRAEWLNAFRGLFIKTLLKLENLRYCYGRAYKMDLIKETIIKLPIKCDNNGNPIIDNNKKYSTDGYIPDWNFIDEYIRSLSYGDKIK